MFGFFRQSAAGVLIFCVSLLIISPGFVVKSYAQSLPVLTVAGIVLDPSGAVISHAHITLRDQTGASVEDVDSGNNGSFVVHAGKSGLYTLEVSSPGFRTVNRPLTISGGTPLQLRIALPIDSGASDVTVTAEGGSVSTETSDNRNTTDIDADALTRLPVLDQDYIALLSQFLDSGAVGTSGVTMVVNGVEANGPGVTASAIKSVKINNNPYSALYSRPGRARVDIETKSGTRQYHGQLNFGFRDAVFDAKQAYAKTKPPEQRRYFEGSSSGPLWGKKDSFLVSANYDTTDNQAVVNAVTLSGPVNVNVPTPASHFFGQARWFHDFKEGHQFWIGYSYEQQTRINQGVGGTVLPEAGYKTHNQEHEITFADNFVVSAKWLNQFRMLVGHQDTPTISNLQAPAVIVSGAFTGGGAQADSKRTETHIDATDTVSYSTGKHQVRFGIDIPDWSRRGADDWTNQLGAYTFGSLTSFAAASPATLVLNQGEGHLTFLEKTFALFSEDSYKVKQNLAITLGARYYFQNYFHDDANNIAPRFGFAWSPGKQRSTVVRGGAGIFYDRTGPRPIADLLHFNGLNIRRYILDSPPYPTVPLTSGLPTSVVVVSPSVSIPYVAQWSLGVEHQLASKSVITAEWVSTRGIKQFRSIDTNAPLSPGVPRPNPALGQVRTLDSDGHSRSDALELSFKGSITKWFKGQAQYRLSKSSADTEGITFFPANSYAPGLDYARSSFDQRNRFSLLGTLSLPWKLTLGTNINLATGKPYDETTGQDNNGDGVLNDRPIGVPRNALNGPAYSNVDLRLSKDFKLDHRKDNPKTVSTSVSAFNVFNTRNDVTYIGVVSSPFFGRAVAALPPRRIQMNVSMSF